MPDPQPDRPSDPWAWQPPQPSRWQQSVALIRLEGPDSRRFLHGQSSQDLERTSPGTCLPTCCLSPTARLRGLAEVLVDRTGAWLVVTAGDGAAIHRDLDRVLFPADQVQLGALETGRLIHLVGSQPSGGEPAAPAPVPTLPGGTWQPLQDDGTGAPSGRWLAPPPAGGADEPQAPRRADRLLLPAAAGAPAWLEALPALGPLEAERWRLQRGLPALPGEINDELNPFELGLAGRVSLSKGCYVGQETLAKLAAYDGVKQQLRRWVWTAEGPGAEPEPVLRPGAPLTTATGERAGRISSVLALPADGGQPGQWIGLALVRRGALELGSLEAGPGFSLRLSCPDGFQPPPGSGSGR